MQIWCQQNCISRHTEDSCCCLIYTPALLLQGGEIPEISEDAPMQLCDTTSVIKPVWVVKINALPPELIDHLGESFPKRAVESLCGKQWGNTEKKKKRKIQAIESLILNSIVWFRKSNCLELSGNHHLNKGGMNTHIQKLYKGLA